MQQDQYGIYDIYTFIHVPFWKTALFRGAFSFLLILAIVFAFFYCLKIFFLRKKTKNLSIKSSVLKQLDDTKKEEDAIVFYSNLSFVIRLFFTDIHDNDMISLTEQEIIKHIDNCTLCNGLSLAHIAEHCVICKNNYLLLHNWKKDIKKLLEKINDIKYNTAQTRFQEAVINDINIVTVLVHSVYFKNSV